MTLSSSRLTNPVSSTTGESKRGLFSDIQTSVLRVRVDTEGLFFTKGQEWEYCKGVRFVCFVPQTFQASDGQRCTAVGQDSSAGKGENLQTGDVKRVNTTWSSTFIKKAPSDD